MTMQQRDKISIDGEEQILQSLPFDDFIPLLAPYIKFTPTSSGCWHGYNAKWTLENGILYLVEFKGLFRTRQRSENVDLNYLFPSSNKVKAWWFTGELCIPQGEPYACYGNTIGYGYEEYLIISVEFGIEISRNIKRFEKIKNKYEEDTKI
jgi:hypothetical protein